MLLGPLVDVLVVDVDVVAAVIASPFPLHRK